MKMEEMVEAFTKEGFGVVKEYNSEARYYRFHIKKDFIEVAGNFKYPAGKDFGLKDRLQREFIEKLIDKWRVECMKYEEREKENMTMENMVKTLEKRGFYVEKIYDRKLRVYEFYIAKDSIGVVGNFEYPKSAHYPLVDRAQRVFIEDLVREWNKAYVEKNKKGESNMRNINNLIRDLAINNKAKLVYGNDIYDIVVRDAMTDCRPGETSNITITCGLVADGFATYARKDVEMTGVLYRQFPAVPKIKDVIFNPPATIVFWADNTKTVVKCQEGDDFDAEKGLTMAITKKIFGNKGNYCEEIKKWVKKYKPEPVELNIFELMSSTDFKEVLADRLEKVFGVRPEVVEVKKSEPIVAETPETADPEKRWKVWWKRYNVHGKHIGSGVHRTDYACKSSATRAAHRMFDGQADIEWIVSQDNPWEEIK